MREPCNLVAFAAIGAGHGDEARERLSVTRDQTVIFVSNEFPIGTGGGEWPLPTE